MIQTQKKEIVLKSLGEFIISEDDIIKLIILIFKKDKKWYDKLQENNQISLNSRFIDPNIFLKIINKFSKNIIIKDNITFKEIISINFL